MLYLTHPTPPPLLSIPRMSRHTEVAAGELIRHTHFLLLQVIFKKDNPFTQAQKPGAGRKEVENRQRLRAEKQPGAGDRAGGRSHSTQGLWEPGT